MRMQVFSMRQTPAAALELTSSFRRMTRFHVSMVPYSPSPKSSVRNGFSRRIKTCSPFCHGTRNDSPQANPHRYGKATTKNLLSKLITPLPPVLPTKRAPPGQDDGYALLVALMPCISRPVSILLGCWIQKLGRLPHQTSPRHLP